MSTVEYPETEEREMVATPVVVESVTKPTGDAQRRVFSWTTLGLRTLQFGAVLALGYWLASLRMEKDHRIELPSSLNGADGQHNSEAVAVTVAPVTQRKIERAIEAVGNLYGYDELAVKTKVSGRVIKVHHDFADKVAPGELLLEIDPTDAQLSVEQARRSLNSELAKWGFADVPHAATDLTSLPTVVSARLRSEWSRSQFSRLLTLQSRGSVTAEELEQAKTNAAVAESDYTNQLLLARAGAATALLKKADLDIAEQHLRETKIYAPQRSTADGLQNVRYTVTERFATEGAWLAVGSDVFKLVINETLKLRLSIPEKHAAALQIGKRVVVTTLTATQPVEGKVTRVSPAVDPQTRTFQIEIEIPNESGALKSGGFAKGRVVVEEAADALTVPTEALVTFAGIHKVFALDGDRVVEHRVKLGEQTSNWVEIAESTLPADAQVIITGQSRLADGSLVRLRTPGADAAEGQPAEGHAAL